MNTTLQTLPDPDLLCDHLIDQIRGALPSDTLVVGIRTGGVWIAERIQKALYPDNPVGMLDISFYRDDFARIGLHPQVKPTTLPFDIEDRPILLVDDVFYTGRTVRAAMNELFDWGRPALIRLAVLVDRGRHELPFTADYAGIELAVDAKDDVQLRQAEDGRLVMTLHHG
jgi:pyrimidine operon attenuation protein/uracil phosphoribosyltransferase